MEIDFALLRPFLRSFPPEHIDAVEQAFDLAVLSHEGQKREDGSPYVTHVLEVAQIIAQWGGDYETVIAALLHDTLEDTSLQKAAIAERFGRHVAVLVEGVTKFTKADFSDDVSLDSKIETLRRLFEVMRRDMRVLIIKLADRLHNIRTIHHLPDRERRIRFARETLDVYYKLAHHLGMRAVRREYSEYSVPVAYPDTGSESALLRDRLCAAHEHFAPLIEHALKHASFRESLSRVFLEPRDLFTLYQRIDEKKKPLLTDAFSLICIVDTDDACYRILKALHKLYRPVSSQFRDFIAAPNEAGYQSLHTWVTMPDGSVLEIRIRTKNMHDQAERGILQQLFSHERGADLPSRFSWLQRTEDLDLRTREDSHAFWEGLETDILRDSISVTVDGHRVTLPLRATVLDAAYALYNADAAKTLSATIGGVNAPLSQTLLFDDAVQLLFDTHEHVRFEWLKYIATRHARGLIVDILKKRSQSEKIVLGAQLLQKEMDYYKKGLLQELRKSQLQSVVQRFHRLHFDEILSMIGEGALRARDVVFHLYPPVKQERSLETDAQEYVFRLHITGAQERRQNILSDLSDVSRLHEVSISHTDVHLDVKTGIFSINLSGTSPDRMHFADFIDALERTDAISTVNALLPRRAKVFLISAFFVAFVVILVDIVLLPQYQGWFQSLSGFPRYFLQVLPLLPILFVNSSLLRLVRQYVVRMRTDRWFLGMACLLNIIGLILVIARMSFTRGTDISLLSFMSIFVLSLLFLGYRFFQTEALFESMEKKLTRPLARAEWIALRRQKFIGYCIRIVAVIVWGSVPLYIKYTPVNTLSPFLRTFLMGIGVFFPSLLVVSILSFFRPKRRISWRLQYNSFFVMLVIGQIGYAYLQNASLLYTSGTNLLLFNNFAPLIGLIVAAIFWRKDIPYLRQPTTMFWVFLLAVLAGISSSLLIYSNAIRTSSQSIAGDALAMASTFFEVMLTVGQIEYLKRLHVNGIVLNLHIFFFMLLCTSPTIIAFRLLGVPIFAGSTHLNLLLGMGIGLFVGFGQLLNYEAFKRIDGYIAYIMFNLSIIITFIFEAFFVHSLHITPLLLLSGFLIIVASLTAEFINSRCQKQGL